MTMASDRLMVPVKVGGAGVNETNNDTIANLLAVVKKEENEMSETGGEEY